MKVTQEEVEHIAKLVRLEISSEDKQGFVKEFSDILSYVEKLNEIKLDEITVRRGWLVDPKTGEERMNKWREDKITKKEGDEVRDKFISLASDSKDGYVKTISPLK